MIKSVKVMLLPNNRQTSKIKDTLDAARYAYNWTIALQMKYFKEKGRYLSDSEARKLFTEHKQQNQWLYKVSKNDGIGIDVGVKDTATDSNGGVYENINKTQKVKRLKKKQRRLQRKVSRKYLINKEGESYRKTGNIIKSEKQLIKINQRLTGIRHNHIHDTTSKIIKQKPSFVCMEDLNVQGMMRNKHLSKAIQKQCLYEFKRQIQYKCNWNGTTFIEADRYFPSSKTYITCGEVKKDLKLSERTFTCESCGNEIDRDYQAALNLKGYGQKMIA